MFILYCGEGNTKFDQTWKAWLLNKVLLRTFPMTCSNQVEGLSNLHALVVMGHTYYGLPSKLPQSMGSGPRIRG